MIISRNQKPVTGWHSFTLIELLIVLVIIGIVTTLAIPRYKRIIRKAQAAEAKRILRAISDQMWQVYVEQGNFPSSAQFKEIVVSIAGNSSKYLNYYDGYMHPLECRAAYKDSLVWGGGPLNLEINPVLENGEVLDYFIIYKDIASSGTDEYAQKMDNTWYRYFGHVKKVSGSQTVIVWNWGD